MTNRWYIRIVGIFLLLGASVASAASACTPAQGGAPAGQVLFVTGRAEAQYAGQSRILGKSDPVCAGESLLTAKDALLQLRMSDGGAILLRADSRLTLEEFVFKGVEDGSERSTLALLKGGFRAITGAIGKLNKAAYRIHTLNATVGIRGTDHETYFVPAPLPGQQTLAEPGTYNKVISGATVLQTENGKLAIGPNQIGFAGMRGAPPVLLDTPPAIFNDPTARAIRNARNGDAEKSENHDRKEAEEKSEKSEKSAKHELRNHADSHESNGRLEKFDDDEHKVGHADTEVVSPIKVGDDEVELHSGLKGISPAPPASLLIGVYNGAGTLTAGSVKSGDNGANLLIGDNHDPASASNNTTRFNYLANDAKLIQSGVVDEDGIDAHWGIYAGGVSFDPAGRAIPVGFHHFVFLERGVTPLETLTAMNGTASFSRVDGFSPPTNELGGMGGSVKADISINLGPNAAVTAYHLAVSDAQARNWNGSFNGNVAIADFAQRGVPLSVSCSGAFCGSGVGAGSAVGALVGPAAKALVTSYGMTTTSGQQVAGVAVLSRP